MGSLITYATSKEVTSELFAKLNNDRHKDNDYPSFNVFNPARREASKILDDTEDKQTKLEFDVFDDIEGVEELQQLIQNDFQAYHEANHWIDAKKFAVLDDRSTKDKTVVIWNNGPIFELDEQVGSQWLSWRVNFPDAHEMVSHLVVGSAEIVDQVFTQARERFTDDNGIFELQKAMKELGYKE